MGCDGRLVLDTVTQKDFVWGHILGINVSSGMESSSIKAACLERGISPSQCFETAAFLKVVG